MNELETALNGSNEDLSLYLELVEIKDFKSQVKELLAKRENPDRKALKKQPKDAIDAA